MAEGGVSCSIDQFSCSICLEEFRRPKLLPCFHTFCVACLETSVNKTEQRKTLDCPLCRTRTEVPTGGVDAFQANFYIEAAKEILPGTSLQCDVCGPDFTAQQRCIDCEENVCNKCIETHSKMKVLRHHKLIDLSNVDPKVKRKVISKAFCDVHPADEVRFVCKQCDKMLCIVCKLTDHENHPTKDISSEAKEIRNYLASAIDGPKMAETVNKTESLVSKKEMEIKKVESILDDEIRQIKEQRKTLDKLLDELEEEAMQRVKRRWERYKTKLQEEKQELGKQKNSAMALKNAAQLVIDHGNDMEIIKKGKQLKHELDRLKAPGEEMSVSHEPLFKPGKVSKSQLAEMFGQTPGLKRKIAQPKRLKLMTQYSVPKMSRKPINGIAPIRGNKAWICSRQDNSVHLVSLDGKVLQSVDVGSSCDSIVVNDKMEVFIMCRDDKTIKCITKNNKCETFIAGRFPLEIACLTFLTGKQCICTCGRFLDEERGMVWIARGQTEGTVLIDNDTIIPFRVCTDGFEKLCIVDYTNGVLTFHDSDGRLLGKFRERHTRFIDACFYSSEFVVALSDSPAGTTTLNERCFNVRH